MLRSFREDYIKMFRIKNLLLSIVVLALIFSFSFYNRTSDDDLDINALIYVGPENSFAQSFSGDDDDDDPDEDDDDTDDDPFIMYSFFDLRDRETFVQVTNIGSGNQVVHVQVFNVANDCNENNFYDAYTGNDTHVYNLRDILTNDGNPAGFVLPDNAYGAVIISSVTGPGGVIEINNPLEGNVRMSDDSGYEYRTNLPGKSPGSNHLIQFTPDVYTFNYNSEAGVILSDVFGVTTGNNREGATEVTMSDPTATNNLVDIDIFDLNEVPFSCRDILFACVEPGGSRYQETLEEEGIAVAGFEYGINDAVLSSKGAELLCPNNTISDGFVRITQLDREGFFVGFVGLNNGNGRGSLDSFWRTNQLAIQDQF